MVIIDSIYLAVALWLLFCTDTTLLELTTVTVVIVGVVNSFNAMLNRGK